MKPKPKLELDRDWWWRTLHISYPRLPQAILCNGVVVGYRHERSKESDERFVAVSDDPEIQKVIDEFARDIGQRCEQDREAAMEYEKSEAERKRRAARKALGLDAQDERREMK